MKRLALLALLVLAAGCGGDGGGGLSKAEYQTEVQGVGETLAKSIEGLGSAVSGTANLKAAAEQIDELQQALADAADDLAALEPPSEVDGAHDKLVEGIREFADGLDKLEEAMADGDLEGIQEFEAEFTESDAVRKITEASGELEKKGYKIG